MPGAVYEFIETYESWRPPANSLVVMIIAAWKPLSTGGCGLMQCLELEQGSMMLKKRWHDRARWRRVS